MSAAESGATDSPAVDSFANHILIDWDSAMGEFFHAVEKKMRARNLTVAQVHEALNLGYGYEVGDAWDDWMEES